jgi:uncharacterized protein (DUF427 family)
MSTTHTQPTRGASPRLEDIVDRVQNTNIEHLMFEPTAKRVRAMLAGITIADSTNVMIMHEPGRLAVYYFPIADVRQDLLTPSSRRTTSPLKGEAQFWSVQVGDTIAHDAVWSYPNPPDGCPDISKHVALYWNSMDRWLEEDEEVFVHPRDPYHRIDVLESSRQIRVVLNGETVAETTRALSVRDNAARPLLHPQIGRAPGSSRGVRQRDSVRLQGHHLEVLEDKVVDGEIEGHRPVL